MWGRPLILASGCSKSKVTSLLPVAVVVAAAAAAADYDVNDHRDFMGNSCDYKNK